MRSIIIALAMATIAAMPASASQDSRIPMAEQTADRAEADRLYADQRKRDQAEADRVAKGNLDRQSDYDLYLARQKAEYDAKMAQWRADVARQKADYEANVARCLAEKTCAPR